MENPYTPPKAEVNDPDVVVASLSVKGLVRLFQRLIIASTIVWLLLLFSSSLPLPLSEDFRAALSWSGAGAIAPSAVLVLEWMFVPCWIIAAIGMYFFQRWARILFVSVYVLSTLSSLARGVVVWLPWEMPLYTLTTLMDGAIIALAFLPPLSSYFERK